MSEAHFGHKPSTISMGFPQVQSLGGVKSAAVGAVDEQAEKVNCLPSLKVALVGKPPSKVTELSKLAALVGA